MHTLLFQSLLKDWHRQNERLLPWVDEKNPYKIWISEIILQQTRVQQGLPYYLKFIEAFPDIFSLAKASETLVFKHWEGLGYYSRARNLHWTAKFIVDHYKGEFPKQYNKIIKLKGIGPYTAAAIASFAFSLPYAVLDGNVHRVLSRVFCIKADLSTSAGREVIQKKVNELLDFADPGRFNQALMDFGAMVCLPASPKCSQCVFADHCKAFQTDSQKEYPFKKLKPPLRNRYFQLFLILSQTEIVLTFRKEKDIWRGLSSFPFIETVEENWEFPEKGLTISDYFISKNQVQKLGHSEKQLLTHQRVHLSYHLIKLSNLSKQIFKNDFIIIPINQMKNFPFPKSMQRFIENNQYLFQSK